MQALNWIRGSYFDFEGLRSPAAMQAGYFAQRRREPGA